MSAQDLIQNEIARVQSLRTATMHAKRAAIGNYPSDEAQAEGNAAYNRELISLTGELNGLRTAANFVRDAETDTLDFNSTIEWLTKVDVVDHAIQTLEETI